MYKPYKDLFTAKTFLEIDANGKPTSRRLKIAVATLLWEMAYADNCVSSEEREEITSLLDQEFHQMDGETGELLEVADYLHREAGQLNKFIDEVNSCFDKAQREHLFEMLIIVAKADGFFDASEKTFANYLKNKLLLDDIG